MKILIKIAIFIVIFTLPIHGFVFARPNLKVGGVVAGDKPMAIVNGELVKEGDVISGAKVEKIGNNFVKFKYENEYIVEYLGGGGSNTASKEPLKVEKKVEKPEERKTYYEELLDAREKAKKDLEKVKQQRVEAEEHIKRKIEALRGTGITDLLSDHSAKDEEDLDWGKKKDTWP
jgi:hypothetical protein